MRILQRNRLRQGTGLLLLIACMAGVCGAQTHGPLMPADGAMIDLPMLRDPSLPLREVRVVFSPATKRLWVDAMARREYDLRMNAILALADVHRRGIAEMDDVPPMLVEPLVHDPDRNVRLAAARAIADFDYKDAAAAMLEASTASSNVGLDMIAVVDPALARWDYPPARKVWLERIALSDTAPVRAAYAMRCLGQVHAEEAIDPLLSVTRDRTTSDALRLSAARALGCMADSRIRDAAESLSGSDIGLEHLLAVSLLASDINHDIVPILKRLAGSEPVVAAHALAALNRIDPGIITGQFRELADTEDPTLRAEWARAAAATPSSESIDTLASSLADPDVDIRGIARDALIHFSEEEALHAQVRRVIASAVHGDDWRSLEQAALIIGVLGIEEHADRLVELLAYDRPETRLAAAGALCRLNVDSAFPAILTRIRTLSELALESGSQPQAYNAIARESTQLLMAIGQRRYEPAADVLRRYIPKHSGFDGMARGAAIYALGRIYENNEQSDLTELFRDRLADDAPIDPESVYVRRFAAIGLGRMRTANGLTTLKDFYSAEEQITSVAGACRWALMQIEPSELPPLKPIVEHLNGYFMESITDHGTGDGHGM